MTDWGDYTPGPWRDSGWDCFEEEFEPCRVVNVALDRSPAETFLVCIYGKSDTAKDWSEAYQDERTVANARLISKAYLIPRLEALLDEWLDTPYFDTADDWAAWCSPFRARVLNVLAALLHEEPVP